MSESVSLVLRKTVYQRRFTRALTDARRSGMGTVIVYAALTFGGLAAGLHADLRSVGPVLTVPVVALAAFLLTLVSTVRPWLSPVTDDLHSLIHRLPLDHRTEFAIAVAIQVLPLFVMAVLVMLYLLPLNGLGAAYFPSLGAWLTGLTLHQLASAGRGDFDRPWGAAAASAVLLGGAAVLNQPGLLILGGILLGVSGVLRLARTHQARLAPGFLPATEANFLTVRARKLGLDASAATPRPDRLPSARLRFHPPRDPHLTRTLNHVLSRWPLALSAAFTPLAYLISLSWTPMPVTLGPIAVALLHLGMAGLLGPEVPRMLPVTLGRQQLTRVLPGALLASLVAMLGAGLSMRFPAIAPHGAAEQALFLAVTILSPLVFLVHLEWLQRTPVADPESRSRLRLGVAMFPAVVVSLLVFFGLTPFAPVALLLALALPIADTTWRTRLG